VCLCCVWTTASLFVLELVLFLRVFVCLPACRRVWYCFTQCHVTLWVYCYGFEFRLWCRCTDNWFKLLNPCSSYAVPIAGSVAVDFLLCSWLLYTWSVSNRGLVQVFWAIFLDWSLLDNFLPKDQSRFYGSVFMWRHVYSCCCLVICKSYLWIERYLMCGWRFWSI